MPVLSLPGQVRLRGQRWDVEQWLDAADVFVLTSESEGPPLAILEAMAKGLPVVATAVGGVPEALGTTGCLLPQPRHDAAATVRTLVEVLQRWESDTALRTREGAASRARACALFREARMLAQTDGVIDQALL